MNYIREYWEQITSGKVLVNNLIYLQMELLIDDLDNPKSVSYQNELDVTVTMDYIFDEERGEFVIDFIEQFCKHSKAPWTGQKVKLEVWQKARIQAAYGFIDKNTGLRQYSEVMTIIGRKNGKTTEGASIGMYGLVADGEGGAEVYAVATKKDIAKKSFGEACNMVSQSEDLREIIYKVKNELAYKDTFSSFLPLASDADTLDGLNSSLVLADEIHAWKTRDLYDVMVQSTGARLQPMMWIMSTLGFVRESICDSKVKYAENCLKGIFPRDYNKLYFIYRLDDRSEWTDPKMWIKANPGLGVIKTFKYLKDRTDEAINDPMLLPTVLTKDFNIIDTIAGSWLNYDVINNESTFDIETVRDTYAIGGVDLSSTTDLTCATLLIMQGDDPEIKILQKYFIPKEILQQKIDEDKVPYDIWERQGLVHVCDGATVSYADVTAWFISMHELYDITTVWVGYDPWNASYWVEDMESHGFEMIKVIQGALTLSSPMKHMAGKLAENIINYNNNPILKWCLTNTSVKRDENDNIRPLKGKGQKLRIDGAVSLIIAYTILHKKKADYITLI